MQFKNKQKWTWLAASLGLVLLVSPSQAQFGTPFNPNNNQGGNQLIRGNPNLNFREADENKAQMGQDLIQRRDPAVVAPDPRNLQGPRVGALDNQLYSSDRPWWNDNGPSNDYQNNGYYPVAPGIFIPNPQQAYFQGVSDLIRAQGQYGLDYERARLLNQEVYRSRYRTQYEKLQLELYRRSLIPTGNEVREARMQEALRRARNNPPLTEILNADALNVLLQRLNDLQGKGTLGPSMGVNPGLLSHINVTTGHGGNIGLLREDGKLTWPFALKADLYREARERIDQTAPNVVIAAQNTGTVDKAGLDALLASWKEMDETLEAQARKMDPNKYISARRYLNLLKDALRALEDPAVSKLFTKKLGASGKTVGEVVANMREGGLKFAPSVPGDEAYYQAWYNRLRDYEDALTQIANNQR